MGGGRVALRVAIALCLVPAAAHAGTAYVRESCPLKGGVGCQYSVQYEAAPGEANDVTAIDGDDGIVFRDAGAPVTAGGGCTALGPNEVRCRRQYGEYAFVRLGDGDDAFRFTPRPSPYPTTPGVSGISAYGEAGRDTLDGGAGFDTLDGGPEADVLRGGPGGDRLFGDSGQALGDDVIDGGTGRDTASWYGRHAPVRVDLADPAPDGSAGESDRLEGIEWVEGGNGGDVLAGTDGVDVLRGGLGSDRLSGRGGDDAIEGGAGDDALIGGAGRDVLSPYDIYGGPSSPSLHGRKRVDCGDGEDAPVTAPQLQDLIRDSCESVELVSGGWRLAIELPLAKLSAPVVSGATACSGSRCDFPVELLHVARTGMRDARPGTVLGRGGGPYPPGQRGLVRLDTRGRALLRERRRIFAQLRLSSSSPGKRSGFTLELRAPG